MSKIEILKKQKMELEKQIRNEEVAQTKIDAQDFIYKKVLKLISDEIDGINFEDNKFEGLTDQERNQIKKNVLAEIKSKLFDGDGCDAKEEIYWIERRPWFTPFRSISLF